MHYLVIYDWKEYNEGSVDILCVEHSLEDAIKVFNKQLVIVKRLTKEMDWDVIEETENSFIAECEEEWSGNYTKLYIQMI